VKRILGLALLAAGAMACGGNAQAPRSGGSAAEQVKKLVQATKEEALGDPLRAKTMHLDLLGALPAPDDPWHVLLAQASLDALVWREISAFRDVTLDTALVYRTKTQDDEVQKRLPKIATDAEGPFVKGLAARALTELAEHRGDAKGAERWRAATGCVRQAMVVGPVVWNAVTGVREKGPQDAFDAPAPESFTEPGPFGRRLAPVTVRGHGCRIDLSATTNETGVRDVLVDVDVKERGWIAVAMRSQGTAVLRVGGKQALSRSYELGDKHVVRFARALVEPGKVRLVARVGVTQDGESLELDAWDDKGNPLSARAPRPKDKATARALEIRAIEYPAARTTDEKVALALGALAARDGRTAERALADGARAPNAPPEMALVYGRAVDGALDLPAVYRAERARSAYERVLEVWPASWEAILAHAVLAGVRRGQGEARIEMLRDMESHRAKASASGKPLLEAFEASVSGRDSLYDRARDALARARPALEGSTLFYDAARAASPRSPADRVHFDCAASPANNRTSLNCYSSLRDVGDSRAAGAELARLRSLRGAPDLYLQLSLHDALVSRDLHAAASAYQAMFPGERTLQALYGTRALATDAHIMKRTPPPPLTTELLAAASTARDAPAALPPLLSAAGSDPLEPFAGVAERVTAADRAHPVMPNAATVILAHDERYDIDPRGLTHYQMLDVRRVSGTTDVEDNAQASPPSVDGRTVARALRRRIFKKDGRVLEPDRTPNASQSHADLSQLEEGDSVEAIYEGWALPGDTGSIGIDTPDLLPDRTAVADASITITLPAALKASRWSHPLLGKAVESTSGTKRTLRFTLKDRSVRRIEDATPKMDRNVAVSLSTTNWVEVGHALRETLAALDEHDPEVSRWAQEAAKGKKPSRELVTAVVEAAGATVREAQPGALSDLGIGNPPGAQSQTARTILTEHEGSRTWLIVRALRELGVATRVVIAEEEPFSSDPNFPPAFGRFTHPLAVAQVPNDKGVLGDVWIDADVPGPPLPAGRISPELRGRMMIDVDGRIAPVPYESNENERDEIDLRLVLDEKGNAKGSFTVLLRGRAAQDLAEALVRVVGVERQRALRNVVLAWVPFANVDDVALSSSEGSWQVALRAEISVSGYAQIEGQKQRSWVLPGVDPLHVVFPRPMVSTLSSGYATMGAREDALSINRAFQYHAHRRVELPPGAKMSRTPGPFELKTDALVASRRLSVNGQVVEDDFVLGVTTGTIAPKDYTKFVTNAHATDDAFMASTRVTPP
jgi:hypothetical protein